MSEETVIVQQEPTQPTQTAPPIESDPFGRNAWVENPTTQIEEKAPVKKAEIVTQTAEPVKPTAAVDEEIIDPKDWLKREFEIDDPEVLKQQIKEYRELKAKPQTDAEIKFENEQSKTIHELIRQGKTKEVKEFLDLQERLENYTNGEVSKDNADEIIKMGMKIKYKDLSPEEINYKFNKEYGVPSKPVQREDELEEDFLIRESEWQEKVNDILMNKVIEAKLIRPELEQAKSKLVLPEIEKSMVAANQPTPEQLEEIRQNFLSQLESNYLKAEGFSTKVKDESVEIPVAFKIPDEDKVAIKGRLEQGLDINDYMDKRWFDEKGSAKVEQIISDLFLFENLDKVLSGVANNSANQRLEHYLKEKRNVSIGEPSAQQTFDPARNGNNSVSPFAMGAWSEKPPVFNN